MHQRDVRTLLFFAMCFSLIKKHRQYHTIKTYYTCVNIVPNHRKEEVTMKKEIRNVYLDEDLNIEAYRFQGISQKFPNHFHEYYVIGFIEDGARSLTCQNKTYKIETGDLLLFNPNDNHECEQIDNRSLDYRCINIQVDIMLKTTLEITKKNYLPHFTENVLFHSDLLPLLRNLHYMIMQEEKEFEKEELFFFLMEQLITEHSNASYSDELFEHNTEIETICDYMKNNYRKRIKLLDLINIIGISKYCLLRSFTKQKGISPYNYLMAIRISEAKKLLEKGTLPVEVALETGFVDQSHFSNFFKKLIGLTPKQYRNIFGHIGLNLK